MNIAFLGTGIMGAPMAAHLARAGHTVRCYNRTKAKTQPVVEAGGIACDTPREAAQDAEIIISMVTDGPDVEHVLFGPDGALSPQSSTRPNVLCIDMSTISPLVAKELAQRCSKQGARFLDAPVTGGEVGAQNATLSIMVGGDKTDFEEALPLLQVMGKTFTYCGVSRQRPEREVVQPDLRRAQLAGRLRSPRIRSENGRRTRCHYQSGWCRCGFKLGDAKPRSQDCGRRFRSSLHGRYAPERYAIGR
jgi:hypothetical protein